MDKFENKDSFGRDLDGLIKDFSGKYTDIKLAKGLIINSDDYERRKDADKTGVSTGTYGRYWFYVPKGKVIFKTYDDYMVEIKKCRMVNELLCYELSKQMGIKCAEYELASLDGKVSGVATYDVAKSNEELISSTDFFRNINQTPMYDLVGYWPALEDYENKGYKIDKTKVMLDLYKISVFDSLTMQSDRNTNNVFFLVDKKTKTIRFAPLIDNEFAFNIQNLCSNIKHDLDINKNTLDRTLDYIYKMVVVEDDVKEDSMFKENVINIIDLAYVDPNYGKVLKQFLEGFNVKKAIEKLKKQGVKIGKRYEEFLLMSEDVIKDVYRKKLKEYKIEKEKSINPISENSHMKDFVI